MNCGGLFVGTIVLLGASIAPALSDDHFRPPPLERPAAAFAQPEGMDPPASVVLVSGFKGALNAYGCGVIVADERSGITILTAAHNLAITRKEFITAAGERLRVRASHVVLGHDLALVTADRPAGRYEVAVPAPDATIGARVRVWGPVDDRPFTLQEGSIRPIDARAENTPDGSFAIDCAACGHGDSGTGVFDARGRLVGIVTKGYSAGGRPLFVLAERYRPELSVATNAEPGP